MSGIKMGQVKNPVPFSVFSKGYPTPEKVIAKREKEYNISVPKLRDVRKLQVFKFSAGK